MIDLAGSDDTFWAIGSAGVLPPATTTASTATRSSPIATTSPATTQASVSPPAFYKLDNGIWKVIAPIPSEATLATVPASLAIVDRIPYVAFVDGQRTVRVVRLDGSVWTTIAILSGDATVTYARFLRGTAVPVICTMREQRSGTLDFLANSTPPLHVALSFVPSSAQNLAVAYALGRIRVLFGSGKTLSEQDLDASNGTISGTVTPVGFQAEIPVYGIVHAHAVRHLDGCCFWPFSARCVFAA